VIRLPLGEIEAPNWSDVKNGPKGPKGDQLPCIVCGRGVEPKKAKWVCLDFSNATLLPFNVDFQPTADYDPSMEPIGPDCTERLREKLQGYFWPEVPA
jgi:hypothetical protein